jgi:hypothetical protein
MARTPGITHCSEIYTAAEFKRRVGMNDFSWRAARKAGLRVLKFGRKVYVRGRDWELFLERAATGEVPVLEQVADIMQSGHQG